MIRRIVLAAWTGVTAVRQGNTPRTLAAEIATELGGTGCDQNEQGVTPKGQEAQ